MQIAGQQPKSVKQSTTKKQTKQISDEKVTTVLDLICAWENKHVHTIYIKYI